MCKRQTKIQDVTLKPVRFKKDDLMFNFQTKVAFQLLVASEARDGTMRDWESGYVSVKKGKWYIYDFDAKYSPDCLSAPTFPLLLKEFDKMWEGFCQTCEHFEHPESHGRTENILFLEDGSQICLECWEFENDYED